MKKKKPSRHFFRIISLLFIVKDGVNTFKLGISKVKTILYDECSCPYYNSVFKI